MPRARPLGKALRAIGVALLLLIAVLVVNTLRLRPPARAALAPAPPPAVSGAAVAEHLAAAVRIETVSHEDPKQDDAGKLTALRELLAKTYPAIHGVAPPEVIGGCGVLYTWRGSDPALEPVLFAAHMDVVPIEPGTEAAWQHPPFSGAIEGGFVHGRGTLDDKGQVVSILEAADSLVREQWKPRRTIMIAFGCDEEVGGERGAKVIAATLASRKVRLAWALDEGMAVTEDIVPDVDRPVALIGLGEKGYLTLELSVEMPGGHASMPPSETAVSVVAAAVDRVARSPMPTRLTAAPRAQMEALAPFMPFGKRLGIANLWLLEPLVRATMAKKVVTNAAVRTTTAPTIIEGGVKDNVLPSRAYARVNHRILPGDTVESVIAHVRAAIADPRVRLSPSDPSNRDPSPIASRTSHAYKLIESTIQRFYPEAVVVPGLVLGGTDGRHYASIAGDVYHFAPFVLHGNGERESIHGTNERVRVRDLEVGVGIFRELMRDGN